MVKLSLGVLTGKVNTDNQKLLEDLFELYSIPLPSARFTKAWKKGYWDGKKHFISKDGEFQSGLATDLILRLESAGLDVDVEHLFDADTSAQPFLGFENEKLRSYQEQLVTRALESRRCLIQSPTGSGKTLVIASLVKSLLPRNIIILFHQKGILTQTIDYFKKLGFDNVGYVFGEGYKYGNPLLVSAYSIEKIVGTLHENANVLIVDEVHEFSSGKLLSGIISCFPSAQYRFGLSATIPNDKLKLFTLKGAFGEIVQEVTAKDLVDSELLAKPKISIIQCLPTEEICKTTFPDIYDEYITNNQFRNLIIATICATRKPGSKTLILVNRLQHISRLLELIPDAIVLEGLDDSVSRKRKIQQFKNSKENVVIIGTKILQTGISINEITDFINARGLKSEIATLQALGRALRIADDKVSVNVFDFFDGVPFLEHHSKNRIKTYKKEKYTVSIEGELKFNEEQRRNIEAAREALRQRFGSIS